MKNTNKKLEEELKQTKADLAEAEEDRAELAESLQELRGDIETRAADRVAAEKGRNNALQGTIDSLRRDLSAHEEEMVQLEKDKQETVRELDELKYWKSVYESGHGLQEMAKSLKKVKDDNRRLTVELQQANEKHGILMDAHAGQSRAFSKLKEETGKGADFSYSDVDIRQEVMSTNDSLKAQLDDANEGIALLEAECTQLRNALKKQAEASKVKGNAAIDLSTIDELSAANARARELSKENAKLKEELEKQKSKLERVERELGGKLSGQPLTMITSSGAPSDVARLMQENAEMHRRMDALQSELIDLVKHNNAQVEEKLIMSMGSQSALPAGATEEQKKLFADTKRASLTTAANQEVMVAMLARNNEMLLQEIQELKRHYQQPRIFPPHQQTEVIADRKTGKSLSLEKTSPSPSMHPPLHPTTPQVNQQNLNTTFASGGSSMWTPGIGRGGMPFFSTTNTPVGMGGFQSVGIGAGPQTPQGKMLLANTLTQLNLPPEEWALDVRDLNSQLVECLEQLYEREEELEEQRGLVSALEDNLVMIKEQMAALYHDYALRSSNWETKEHKFKSELKGLLEDRDDLRLKLRRMHELSESLKQSDATSMQAKISELTRKVTIYEVNEAVLSRKYTSQAEQLQLETEKMQRLQVDFVEMESSLKKRILYLEQYKLSAGSRLAQIQGKLDVCVPQEDYKALLSEIEVLREDHLNTLRREVEAKMSAMNSLDQARELRSLRLMIAQVRADYDASRASVLSLQAQLEHQKLTTEKALKAAKSSAEMTSIISELARFRGETARLEVEQVASSRRVDYLSERLEAVTKEADKYSQRVQELEKREEDAAAKESAAKKMVLEMQLKFEAGLTKDEADNLRSKLEKVQQQFEETQREVSRQRELAEIASLQAETIGSFRGQHASELKELREYCAKLESRSEDELLIGRLQRQLISTKTSYKSFVRKYQLTRDNLRKRELAMRILEAELDSRTNEGSSLQEALRKEIESLKKALRDMKNSVLDDASSDRQPNRGSKPTKPSSARMVRMGDKLLQVSSKVNELAELAEDSVNRTIEMEGECRRLQGLLQDVESDKHHYKQQVADLTSIVKGHSKQQVVASRLVSLSEDLRVSKLNSLQQRRQIEVLRKEKRHLQSVITNMEADVLELEEGKVLAETKSVLFADGESTAFKSSAENGYGEIKEMQEEFIAGQQQHQPHPEMARSSSQGLTINTALEDEQAAVEGDTASQLRAEGISAEDLFEKLQQSHNQLVQSRKQASEYKLQASNFASRLSEFEAMLEEARGQIAYYERVLAEEGMPTVLLRDPHYVLPGNNSNHVTSRHYRMRQEEQEKLQEAASATIGSLRSLLEEKNRVLEKYREKLEFLQQSAHIKSRADRRAEELLEKIDRDEANRERNAGSVVKEDYSSEELRKKLTEQIEQADSIIADKDRTIAQLEQKLLSQINQRERAENRCGESIKEMEAMKEDMVTLMKQLQDSEERAKHVTKAVQPQVAVADVSRVRELEKLLKSKVEKVRGYREIIIKLKDEFIKSEEERAAVQLRQQMDRGESSGGGAMTADELRDLKDKVKDLHDGLRQAKDDLSRAKKVREKLTQERDAAVEELKTFETRLFKSEAASKNAQDSQQHLRKELEDSRKKEFRMREKLKEYLSANESTTAKLRDLETAQERVKFLERELEFLQTQNIALRKDLKLSDPGTNSRGESKGEGDRKALGELNNNALRAGYVLGVGNGPEFADTALDLDTRKQMHARWETDKKSSKRY